jgi:tRNA (cmo5U34)-methyltransferase
MSDEMKDNRIPNLPEDYDKKISTVLPYYSSFHQETINFVSSISKNPDIWLDTGCGTGSLVSKAIEQFPDTKFLMLDPSEGMLEQAREKLSSYDSDRIEFLRASTTQEFSSKLERKIDVITAIQCHHYLDPENREKAVKVCHELLKEGGIFVTFENIRPLTKRGVDIGKQYWAKFQLNHERSEEEIETHLARFDVEYFPLTIEQQLEMLRNTGFKTVEIFWYSYMQAGFYCIK